MTYEPNTAEVTREALLRLNPMACPIEVYDEILNAGLQVTVSQLIKNAEKRGWTRP